MLEQILALLTGWDEGLKVFFLAMLPVSELRAAIPLGILWGIEPLKCFFWAIAGNFVPVIPLFFMLPVFYRLIIRFKLWRRLLVSFVERISRKGRQVEKYGAIGLMMFVAVPLPGTGVWTGVAIALLLGIELKYTLIAIALGEILAGIAVTLASIGVFKLSKFIFGIEILTILALIIIVCYWLWKRHNII